MGEDFEVLDSSPEGPPVLSLQTPQQPSCVHKKCSSEGKLLRELHEKQCMDNLTEVRQNCGNTLLKSPPRSFLKTDIPLNNSLSIFQENKNPKSFKKAMIPLLSEQKSLRRNNLASVGSKIRKNINKSQNIPDLKLKQTSILDFFN
ncbi:unnamed protein product [Lymnaea stagnalis]|uniref:Uncharacterized protein n=1 Tax=Lymnaea stagnalis TaxID=6523 RepID=A0AAV2I1E5_LYMST